MTRTTVALAALALAALVSLAAIVPSEPAHTDPEAARQIAKFYATDGYQIESEDSSGVYLTGFYETCRITANSNTHAVTCWAD